MNSSTLIVILFFCYAIVNGTIQHLKTDHEQVKADQIKRAHDNVNNVDYVLNYLKSNRCYSDFTYQEHENKNGNRYSTLDVLEVNEKTNRMESKSVGLVHAFSQKDAMFYSTGELVTFYCLDGGKNIKTLAVHPEQNFKKLSPQEILDLRSKTHNQPFIVEYLKK